MTVSTVNAASSDRASGDRNPGGSGTVTGRVSMPSGEPVAYVYVENVYGAPLKGETVVIEQSKKQFSPGWAVIQKGTTVKFPNLDNIYHNVFSRSPGNSFDLGLYNSSDEAKAHTFFEPGPVDVYCNIHPRMSASVLVVPNRHFVKVKADGTFQLDGVPAGKRKLVAWSPSSAASSEWVELNANGRAEVEMKLQPKSSAHKNKEGRSYGSYE
jgi:plastocyanin